MKYIVIFKPDMFKEGTIEHILQADGLELQGDFITLYRTGSYSKTTVAMYRADQVIYAGLYETHSSR